MGWRLFAHWLVDWPGEPPDDPEWARALSVERARRARRVVDLGRVNEELRAFGLPEHREPTGHDLGATRSCTVHTDWESLRQLQCVAAHLDRHAAVPRSAAELDETAELRAGPAPRVWRFAQVHRALSRGSRIVLLPGPPRPVLDLDGDPYEDLLHIGDLARAIDECTMIANLLGATREEDPDHDWWLETGYENPSFPGLLERLESPADLFPAASASLALVQALRTPLELGSACFLEPSY